MMVYISYTTIMLYYITIQNNNFYMAVCSQICLVSPLLCIDCGTMVKDGGVTLENVLKIDIFCPHGLKTFTDYLIKPAISCFSLGGSTNKL